MLKKTNEVNKSNNINDSFDVIADIIKSNKRASLKNMRVKSFSPVSKTKDSFGLYYDQNHPDSAEIRIKTKGMAYQQNKNLSNYKINDNSKEGYSRNMVPIMSAHTLNFNNPGINIKGIMTASNFSNNEYKDFGAKGSNFLKSYTNQMKYKGKKSTEANNKSTAKYSTNYSSKRPKSAKGVGTYINTSKYRQSDNQASSIYKNSLSKGSISHKYTSSSKSKKHGNSSQLKKTQSIKSITTKTK